MRARPHSLPRDNGRSLRGPRGEDSSAPCASRTAEVTRFEENPASVGGAAQPQTVSRSRHRRATDPPRARSRESAARDRLERLERVGRRDGRAPHADEGVDSRRSRRGSRRSRSRSLTWCASSEDDRRVRRQHAGVGAPAARCGAPRSARRKVVVDDHDLGVLPPGASGTSPLEVLATGPMARLRSTKRRRATLQILGQSGAPARCRVSVVGAQSGRWRASANPRSPDARASESRRTADVVGETIHERTPQRDRHGEGLSATIGRILTEDRLLQGRVARRDPRPSLR